MDVDIGTHLDFFDLGGPLLLAGFVALFLLLILELAVIEYLANRRIGIWGDLNQIETRLFGFYQGITHTTNPEHFSISTYQPNL
jgi:hypothetical protein